MRIFLLWNTNLHSIRLLALVGLLGCPAFAQWVHYPTAGVPQGKDGKPNLAAPAPRASDGHPDFSGMWLIADPLPCPKLLTDDSGDCLEKMPISQITADLSKVVPGGLPLKPWAAQLRRQRTEHEVDPHVHCMPSNFPRFFTLPHITKFVQTRGLLVLMNEFNASYRQIFTDGRRLPEDPSPSWNGYSTARWEGDTLVVETNGFRDDLWMDMAGTPLTNAARVIERFRRPSFGTLVNDATIDDPKAYTRPWNLKIVLKLMLNTELMDEVCLEGEQSAQHMQRK